MTFSPNMLNAVCCGDLSAETGIEHCLDKVAEREDSLQAWAYLDADGAREQARGRDREREIGVVLGPLHGVPIGVKDIIDVAGMPTGAGFRPWRERRAAEDAVVVQALRRAGAVVLGKAETTQFASFDPAPTRHPRFPGRTPGGSSSGSAVAVAAGMCPLALGTQTGGSIIRPASYCGVCGYKPSYGAVSTAGVVPLAPSFDTVGALAVTIGALQAVAPVLVEGLGRTGWGEPPRLGWAPRFFDDAAEASVAVAVQRTVARLREAGAQVEEVALPWDLAEVVQAHRLIYDAEVAREHGERLARYPNDYGPNLVGQIRAGATIAREDYEQACRQLVDHRRQMDDYLAGFDALLTPATTSLPPGRETTGDPRMNSPTSYWGVPTVSFPVAHQEGLPIAVQVFGGRGRDAQVLGIANWCQEQLG